MKIFPFVIMVLMILAGCNSDTIVTPLYKGTSQVIGVIGDTPEVREENIKFITITFNELEKGKELSSNYDAIMIMKDHLSEAAESKYAKVYKNAGIPFCFIESQSSSVPFVHEDLSYEEVPDFHSGMYSTCYYQYGEKVQNWGYGLYYDKVNDSNIKDVYSRMFTTIESIENGN